MKRRRSEPNNKNEPLVVREMNCSSYLELFWLIQQLVVSRGRRRGDKPSLMLPPEIIHKIASFFTVRPVVSSDVQAVTASSIMSSSGQQQQLSDALDESESNWWISELESMPRGVGQEYIEFRLTPSSSTSNDKRLLCRLKEFSIKIPPLPMGPLSVRRLRLEKEVIRTTNSTTGTSSTTDSSWVPISPEWIVENKTGWQDFTLESPVDIQNVRVVCLSNQMAVLQPVVLIGGARGRPGPLQPYSSVGFYCVKFS